LFYNNTTRIVEYHYNDTTIICPLKEKNKRQKLEKLKAEVRRKMITGTTNTTVELQDNEKEENVFYNEGGNSNMKPINIQVPDDLYEAVKNFAKEQDMSMAEVVRSALKRYVYPEGEKQKTMTIKDLAEQIQILHQKIRQIEHQVLSQKKFSEKMSIQKSYNLGTNIEKNIRKNQETPLERQELSSGKQKPVQTKTNRENKTGIYEKLTIQVMKKKPGNIWTLREIYDAIMDQYGEQLSSQGIFIKPESLKDRIARMVRNGTLQKVGRGKYVLH